MANTSIKTGNKIDISKSKRILIYAQNTHDVPVKLGLSLKISILGSTKFLNIYDGTTWGGIYPTRQGAITIPERTAETADGLFLLNDKYDFLDKFRGDALGARLQADAKPSKGQFTLIVVGIKD